VSFSSYARKVRDPDLPFKWRVSALRSCVQLYRPIGFTATLSFLAELAGPFQRDEVALLRALDAIDASRTVMKAELAAYADLRRAAKRGGQRQPRPTDPRPSWRTWHAAPREAALHALRFWRQRRLPAMIVTGDPVAADLDEIAAACLSQGGPLRAEQRERLAVAVRALQRSLNPSVSPSPGYFQTLDLLTVAHHIETAARPTAGQP
jgi:hypothetical protein